MLYDVQLPAGKSRVDLYAILICDGDLGKPRMGRIKQIVAFVSYENGRYGHDSSRLALKP